MVLGSSKASSDASGTSVNESLEALRRKTGPAALPHTLFGDAERLLSEVLAVKTREGMFASGTK